MLRSKATDYSSSFAFNLDFVCYNGANDIETQLDGFGEGKGGYNMTKGTIRRLITDRGFGFIKTEQEEDLFFHRNELQGVDYDSLREGQEVEYEVGQGRNGRSQAVRVRLAETE